MTDNTVPTRTGSHGWLPLVSKGNTLLLASVLVVLLLVGSLWDYQISSVFYDPNSGLGIFGTGYGGLPAGMALVASGTVLVSQGRVVEKNRVAIFAAGFVLYLPGAIIVIILPLVYDSAALWIAVGGGLVVVGLVTAGVFQISRDTPPQRAVRVVVVLLAVLALEVFIATVLKLGFERPRMRLISENPDVPFAPWWHFGNPLKQAMVSAGVPADDFKSFPSSHTANATVLMLLTSMPALDTRLHRFSSMFFWVGAAWGMFIGFTRIVAGAHFVSDTVVGFTITFVSMLFVYHLVFTRPVSSPRIPSRSA